jgi:hypothetical protein
MILHLLKHSLKTIGLVVEQPELSLGNMFCLWYVDESAQKRLSMFTVSPGTFETQTSCVLGLPIDFRCRLSPELRMWSVALEEASEVWFDRESKTSEACHSTMYSLAWSIITFLPVCT